MNTQIDVEQATQFLWALYGHYYNYKEKGKEAWIEVRVISCRGQVRSDFVRASTIRHGLEGVNKRLESTETWNVYFGVNPRPDEKKRQDDIRDVICVWADVDAKNFSGGKDEALKSIHEFPLTPNIVVDSGNGFHGYWVLEEPIIGRTEEQTKAVKQTISGLAIALRADRQIHNLDRILRLPGTMNLKDELFPKPCKVVSMDMKRLYSLGDFDKFKDYHFVEPPSVDDKTLEFEGTELIVSSETKEKALQDVKKLRVSQRIKRLIITGEHLEGEGKDTTRSGRDMAIVTALLMTGYNFETIKSIFYNRHLGCRDRIREKPEKLSWDVVNGLRYVESEKKALTPAKKAILDIEASDTPGRQKTRAVNAYIIDDLFDGTPPLGEGYKNQSRRTYFFFDSTEKLLINIDDEEFKAFLINRYGLLDRDLREVIQAIKAKIWRDGNDIEPRQFAYYDSSRGKLYVSNMDNGMYVLDGKTISMEDNGVDSVIFEFKSDAARYKLSDHGHHICNYFEGGFDLNKFKESLVWKHIIGLASFDTEKEHKLTPEEQEYLLTIWFYSLFFESILPDKPIACFKGVKASGKSTLATASGKLFFGPSFLSSALPENRRDVQVALSSNHLLIFDNLDAKVPGDILNDLCIAATSGEMQYRKLYTDHELIKAVPRVFLAITSREPKFKRDDFVDRLIIFNTQKVRRPKSKQALFAGITKNRDAIMSEILHNLNSILRLLKAKRDLDVECVFRMADWELFGRKIHSEEGVGRFIALLEKMNLEKYKFALEDDDLYILLKNLCCEQKKDVAGSASEIYCQLSDAAEALKMADFKRKYKSSMAFAKRIENIRDELEDEFEVKSWKAHGNVIVYSIKTLQNLSE